MSTKAPAVFFGHGNPMNALDGPYGEEWRALGRRIGKPKAVLMISAHWLTRGTGVTGMESPRTIHDFFGFPPELFAVRYPAPGSPWLAQRVAEILAPTAIAPDRDWGLDHGTWSVLVHVFPNADIPIVQLSIDGMQPAAFHLDLGRRLSALRDEGVMIAGSGDVVHNLSLARFRGGETADPYDWAIRFNDQVKAKIAAGDFASLLPGAGMDADAALSIPTDEHWLPLLYVLGAAGAGEPPEFFTDRIDHGSISMLGVGFGIPGA